MTATQSWSVSADFLATLLVEDTFYPWNPADPASEVFFCQMEQDLSLLDGEQLDHIKEQANQLFEQMQTVFRDYDH